MKIRRVTEQRNVFILSRPCGDDKKVLEHALACCRYAENAGRTPVLNPDIYPQVFRDMEISDITMSIYFSAAVPLEACEDVWIFTQAVTEDIRDVRHQAKLLGISVLDLVGVRLP